MSRVQRLQLRGGGLRLDSLARFEQVKWCTALRVVSQLSEDHEVCSVSLVAAHQSSCQSLMCEALTSHVKHKTVVAAPAQVTMTQCFKDIADKVCISCLRPSCSAVDAVIQQPDALMWQLDAQRRIDCSMSGSTAVISERCFSCALHHAVGRVSK